MNDVVKAFIIESPTDDETAIISKIIKAYSSHGMFSVAIIAFNFGKMQGKRIERMRRKQVNPNDKN
ncbi:hypothetical protein [Candidatus Galacturonibacter soehngenii]|uniref:Uncharacterized protein n=1 Tax=Candidatus Galacturonatibacter soehngenii TaxID=2307010 RepID=A0A7V7QJU5_9FIRM|nr:hypothetical protein [Candidatus Galacturonibacter soehngenii]KAB1437581.1 hypothetical protein F7O84_08215 [Candidatus Galacturonibacter soehngenii]